MSNKELACKIVAYEKEYDLYEFENIYDNDNKAIDWITMDLDHLGAIETYINEFSEDIVTMATHKRNSKDGKLLDDAFNLIKDLSSKYLELEKDNLEL